MPATILVVDDEKHTREGLRMALEDDYDVYVAQNADEAFNLLESEPFDVILTDLRMAGKSGMSVIDKALSHPRKPICIMMTAYGSVDTAVQAMKRGAYDFLTKPLNLEKLDILIRRALESEKLREENTALHERLDKKYQFSGIIGNSKALLDVMETVKRVAPTRATVLLKGETGTGKELFAQALHQNSERSRGPFMTVHCASLAPSLLESELFGHEKGAFTGATERRIGRFEAADQGTLFLDEIGEIDASTQIKLLRFLEQKTFERLGSSKPIKVDIRLIFATNRNLQEMVEKQTFREDLYYRLNVVPIELPPLRDRQDDILLLIDHYIREFSSENNVEPVEFSEGAKAALTHYSWPGNIRELRNFCENIVVLKQGGTITEYDLDPRFMEQESMPGSESEGGVVRNLSKEENEKRLLRNALIQANGNRTKAAEFMGISRRTLHRKLTQWPELDVSKK